MSFSYITSISDLHTWSTRLHTQYYQIQRGKSAPNLWSWQLMHPLQTLCKEWEEVFVRRAAMIEDYMMMNSKGYKSKWSANSRKFQSLLAHLLGKWTYTKLSGLIQRRWKWSDFLMNIQGCNGVHHEPYQIAQGSPWAGHSSMMRKQLLFGMLLSWTVHSHHSCDIPQLRTDFSYLYIVI